MTPDFFISFSFHSQDDILYSRVRTSGIVTERYNIDGSTFEMYDVGGQRNERKKWIHCFEGRHLIIPCLPSFLFSLRLSRSSLCLFFFSFSLYFFFSLSHKLSLFHTHTRNLSLCAYTSFSLSSSLSNTLSLFLSLSLSFCLSPCFSLAFSLSFSLCLPLPLSFPQSLILSLSLQGVTAVIFVAAISEYDQKLFEDASTNRMVRTDKQYLHFFISMLLINFLPPFLPFFFCSFSVSLNCVILTLDKSHLFGSFFCSHFSLFIFPVIFFVSL